MWLLLFVVVVVAVVVVLPFQSLNEQIPKKHSLLLKSTKSPLVQKENDNNNNNHDNDVDGIDGRTKGKRAILEAP